MPACRDTDCREFYGACRAAGLVVEKADSICAKGGYTDAQTQWDILSAPFKWVEDMQMRHQTKTWAWSRWMSLFGGS